MSTSPPGAYVQWKPTHRCKVCRALWISAPGFWSLFSPKCGPCCDNVAMGDQIEPLTPAEAEAARIAPLMQKLHADNLRRFSEPETS